VSENFKGKLRIERLPEIAGPNELKKKKQTWSDCVLIILASMVMRQILRKLWQNISPAMVSI